MKKIILFGFVLLLVVLGILGIRMLTRSSNQTSTSPGPQLNRSGNLNRTYTLIDIASHKDASSCWSAINGKVYDLTSWINQHPGGADRILSICGIDGSGAFNDQHAGQSLPNNELQSFFIGDLSSN